MATQSTIEWTDATWNCVRGCTIYSPGCAHCYAMLMAHRFSAPGMPYEGLTELGPNGPRWTGKIRLVPELLAQPLRWVTPKRIFVNSMTDLFHEDIPVSYIEAVMGVMQAAHWHTYQVLTKRAERMQTLLTTSLHDGALQPHIWWGVSVENRKHGVPRIDYLRHTPAAIRFLSVEPLLEDLGTINLDGIHWVIVGGESGPGARPMQTEWVESLRHQCMTAQVPFFFKQWGGVQKKKTGRTLNGRTFDDQPLRLTAPVPSRMERAALLQLWAQQAARFA